MSWKWVCKTWGWIRKHWDRLVELVLLAGLVVTGALQAMILFRQVKLSEVVERPWVAIDSIDFIAPLTFKDGAAFVSVQLLLKNTGHIPAAHVFALHKFIARSPTSSEVDKIWGECEQFRAMPLETRGSGIGIFPDQPGKLAFSVKMDAEDVKRLGVSGAPVLDRYCACNEDSVRVGAAVMLL